MTGQPESFDAEVIITWPARRDGGLQGALVQITDAVTGNQITTVCRADLTVKLDAETLIWAEAEALCEPDGTMLEPGLICYPNPDGDGPLTSTFRFLVSEMRMAQP